jgi:hypothetical protein
MGRSSGLVLASVVGNVPPGPLELNGRGRGHLLQRTAAHCAGGRWRRTHAVHDLDNEAAFCAAILIQRHWNLPQGTTQTWGPAISSYGDDWETWTLIGAAASRSFSFLMIPRVWNA